MFVDVFGVSSETWSALVPIATFVLVGVTIWYALSTGRAASTATDALNQAVRAADAAERAADIAATAAAATARQAETMEREELFRTMPLLHCLPVPGSVQPAATCSALITNLGQAAAVHVSLSVFVGQLPGKETVLEHPVLPGPATFNPPPLQFPRPTHAFETTEVIEIQAEYQDYRGNRYASYTRADGTAKVGRLVVKPGMVSPTFEPILVPPKSL